MAMEMAVYIMGESPIYAIFLKRDGGEAPEN
jgi:hypothetical protein